MNNQLKNTELAEIVAGLIVNPVLLGQLDSVAEHDKFVRSISEVVADFCGGDIVDVDNGTITVSKNDSLPSATDNVWSNHGSGNWGKSNSSDVLALRKSLQSIMLDANSESETSSTFTRKMVDWRVGITDSEVEEPGDEQEYLLKATMENQVGLEIMDSRGEPVVGILIEINNGVPSFHIDTRGSDPLLHIHVAQGGLVLTPNDSSLRFEHPLMDRYSYNDPNSILIKGHFDD
jgi:hypothetical protein